MNMVGLINIVSPDFQASQRLFEDTRAVNRQDGQDRQENRSQSRLSQEEQRELERLRARDGQVRRHEQAHAAAAGELLTSGPNYDFVTGPDGRRYAVSGNVQIDTAPVPGDPEATIRKADKIVRAALAPIDPSTQDQRIAAQARRMKTQAVIELRALQQEQRSQIGSNRESETSALATAAKVYQFGTSVANGSGTTAPIFSHVA